MQIRPTATIFRLMPAVIVALGLMAMTIHGVPAAPAHEGMPAIPKELNGDGAPPADTPEDDDWFAPSAPRMPKMPPDIDNAALLYYRAGLLMRREAGQDFSDIFGEYYDIGPGWKPPDRLRSLVARNQSAIGLFLRASMVDHCSWGLEYENEWPDLFPTFADMRYLWLLIATDAWLHIGRCGDEHAVIAAERIASMFRSIRHMTIEGPMIQCLFGMAGTGLAIRVLDELLSKGVLPDEARRVLAVALDHLGTNDPFFTRRALVYEHRLLPVFIREQLSSISSQDPEEWDIEVLHYLDDNESTVLKPLFLGTWSRRIIARAVTVHHATMYDRFYNDLFRAWADGTERGAATSDVLNAASRGEYGSAVASTTAMIFTFLRVHEIQIERLRDAARRIAENARTADADHP